jgi:uncharacterized protein YfaT (DUF1175 family)
MSISAMRGATAVLAIILGSLGVFEVRALRGKAAPDPVRAVVSPKELMANGYDRAVLTISGGTATAAPHISTAGDTQAIRIEPIERHGTLWRAAIQGGVMPGKVLLRVGMTGAQGISVPLTLHAQTSDSAADGTPDYLRLNEESDREAFRRWFTYLAELQFFTPRKQRPEKIVDCAALIRYAYREALHRHDEHWAASSGLALVPAAASVTKYSFPHTPLGPALFRVRGGAYRPSDLSDGAFAQFADAETLQRRNTFFVSRDLTRAQPGDLLFFKRDTEHMPFHSMLFLGNSQIEPGPESYVVYHTGPLHENSRREQPGEIRRLTVAELLHYPDPQWQAISTNPSFLGVFRWNILKPIS